MNAESMRRLLASARVAHLATVDTGGHPHAVPACFALVDDVAYSAVDHKPKRSTRLRRLANIEATGRACLLADRYSEDWSQLWWVRADGPARVVNDPAEARRAVDALVAKYPQYAQRPPDGPIIALDVERWSGWSAV
jgi:PPOX class probable F420-dependent enzyme